MVAVGETTLDVVAAASTAGAVVSALIARAAVMALETGDTDSEG
jgi:hypothetical protein